MLLCTIGRWIGINITYFKSYTLWFMDRNACTQAWLNRLMEIFQFIHVANIPERTVMCNTCCGQPLHVLLLFGLHLFSLCLTYMTVITIQIQTVKRIYTCNVFLTTNIEVKWVLTTKRCCLFGKNRSIFTSEMSSISHVWQVATVS